MWCTDGIAWTEDYSGCQIGKRNSEAENVSQIPEPDHIEEDFVTGSYQIKGKTIMKAASIVALIMYFIPVFSLDYGIWNVGNISLIDLVFGISYGGEEIWGFQLGPAIFLLASIGMTGKKEVYKKTILESIGAGIVFIILYFVFNNI